ncbi:MAG: polyphosphate kinase 2, partial [Cyanobacteriota bacterium]
MSKKEHNKPDQPLAATSPPSPLAEGVSGGTGEDVYSPSPILDDFSSHSEGHPPKLDRKFYEKELGRLQVELVKMQYWIKHVGYR